MGVHGTFCQLCGLPTQHDHYVQTRSGMLKIYRGSQPGGGHSWEDDERPFRFGPEHEWLKDAVVLPWDEERVLRGQIEDGALEDVMVFEGGDDGLAFHHACWELQGSPENTAEAVRSNGSHGFALLEGYHEQLFDFAGLEADGNSWMLADPAKDARSKERIVQLSAASRDDVPDPPPREIPRILELDRDWSCMAPRDRGGERQAIVRARTFTIQEADKEGYGDLVHLTLPFSSGELPKGEQMQTLQSFEGELKAAVEKNAEAILVLSIVAKARAELFVWARSSEKSRAVVEQLKMPAGMTIEVKPDPEWKQATAAILRHRR